MDKNKITGALFLDLCKAFDTVNYSILLSKFKLLNPNDQMLNWLKSYIMDRKQVVSFNGSLSTPAFITGVPEGSILGPLLFLMFINDIHSVVSSESVMYADDTTALSHGTSNTEVSQDIQVNLNMIKLRTIWYPTPRELNSYYLASPVNTPYLMKE